MTKTVRLTHGYDDPAPLVWRVATDLDHLRTATKGLLAFRDLPSGQIFGGQQLRVHVSLFGLFPYQPYEMNVVECDHEKMAFASEERGAGVKTWRHTLSVVPLGIGSRIVESIEVDAGILTPLFAVWASYMYRQRHPRRQRILKDLAVGRMER